MVLNLVSDTIFLILIFIIKSTNIIHTTEKVEITQIIKNTESPETIKMTEEPIKITNKINHMMCYKNFYHKKLN